MGDSHIHHVTAVTRDPQVNHDFYTDILGLRFVKKTVNFDDPSAYHLYYADELGTPGTVLTFFHWEKLPDAREGVRSISTVLFAVPLGSRHFWKKRLNQKGVPCEEQLLFGEKVLVLRDPDGLTLALVEREDLLGRPWEGSSVPKESQIGHIHGVELCLRQLFDSTRAVFDMFGYTEAEESGAQTRLTLKGDSSHALYIRVAPSLPPAALGCGSIHHVAFRVADGGAQARVRQVLEDRHFQPTPVIERFYFRSVYFSVPEGVLFEVATDDPGFLIDEEKDTLGTSLCLPPQYESYRERIEHDLRPFNTDESR